MKEAIDVIASQAFLPNKVTLLKLIKNPGRDQVEEELVHLWSVMCLKQGALQMKKARVMLLWR